MFSTEHIYELRGSMFVIATVFKLGLCNSDMWLNLFLNLTGTTVLGGESVCVHVTAFFPLLNSGFDEQLLVNIGICKCLYNNTYAQTHAHTHTVHTP